MLEGLIGDIPRMGRAGESLQSSPCSLRPRPLTCTQGVSLQTVSLGRIFRKQVRPCPQADRCSEAGVRASAAASLLLRPLGLRVGPTCSPHALLGPRGPTVCPRAGSRTRAVSPWPPPPRASSGLVSTLVSTLGAAASLSSRHSREAALCCTAQGLGRRVSGD